MVILPIQNVCLRKGGLAIIFLCNVHGVLFGAVWITVHTEFNTNIPVIVQNACCDVVQKR